MERVSLDLTSTEHRSCHRTIHTHRSLRGRLSDPQDRLHPCHPFRRANLRCRSHHLHPQFRHHLCRPSHPFLRHHPSAPPARHHPLHLRIQLRHVHLAPRRAPPHLSPLSRRRYQPTHAGPARRADPTHLSFLSARRGPRCPVHRARLVPQARLVLLTVRVPLAVLVRRALPARPAVRARLAHRTQKLRWSVARKPHGSPPPLPRRHRPPWLTTPQQVADPASRGTVGTGSMKRQQVVDNVTGVTLQTTAVLVRAG